MSENKESDDIRIVVPHDPSDVPEIPYALSWEQFRWLLVSVKLGTDPFKGQPDSAVYVAADLAVRMLDDESETAELMRAYDRLKKAREQSKDQA